MTKPELTQLDDYLAGVLSDADAAALEEQLFAEAAEGHVPALRFLDQLTQDSAFFAASGGLAMGVTRAQLEQLRLLPRVHYLELGLDNEIAAWPHDTELVVFRLAVDLRGVEQADIELLDEHGQHEKWMRDVSWDADDGAIYGACHPPVAAGSFRMHASFARVVATRDGKRALIATVRSRPV